MDAILSTGFPRFDIVEYIKKLRNQNFTQEQAETIAQETEHMMEAIMEHTDRALKNKELATNSNLRETELRLQKEIEMVRKEIAQASNRVIIWVAGLLFASGLIQHFFK